ncbi:hypothetical protein BKA70DRAFT_1443548 [Coprinopsis sp. MPI-PUGE-AT-0042]|nr:hypothetical protein BKA70DRAFT_1443548 [Coprinopsis sp. MPI-PUGE-AT-0042]
MFGTPGTLTAAPMEWSAQLGNSNPIAFERDLATVANSIVACLALKGTFIIGRVSSPSSYHENLAHSLALTPWHEAGFHAIRDLLVPHPDKLSLFCKVATACIAQVPYLTNKTRTSFDDDFARKRLFTDTWVIIMTLFEDSVMRRGLCKAGYIYFSTMTLLELGGSNPIRNVQKLLDYGYIGVLSEALILSDLTVKDDITNGQHAISSLEGYSYYPRVATSLGNAIKRVSPGRSQALAKLSYVGKHWSHLLQVAHDRGVELEMTDAHTVLCDNNKHHGRSLQRSSRSCSGCHLVLYCSKERQSNDWTSRHRDECGQMHLVHLDRCASGIHLSQKTRAFHLRSLLSKKGYDILKNHFATLGGAKVVCVLDFRHSTFSSKSRDISAVTLESYIAHCHSSDCAQIDLRVSEMIKDFLLNPSTDMCLFEARFLWTKDRVLFLIAEMDMAHGRAEIKRSVVQIM